MKRFAKLLPWLVATILMTASAMAEAQTSLTWSWTPATSGSEVVNYEGFIEVTDPFATAPDTMRFAWSGTTPDTTFTWAAYEYATNVRMQLRGKDGKDRVGVYSQWSEWFIDWGMPGETGFPIVIEVGGAPQ